MHLFDPPSAPSVCERLKNEAEMVIYFGYKQRNHCTDAYQERASLAAVSLAGLTSNVSRCRFVPTSKLSSETERLLN